MTTHLNNTMWGYWNQLSEFLESLFKVNTGTPTRLNSSAEGKYIIVKDLLFSDYFKTEEGNISVFDTYIEALDVCGIYELENVLILKVCKNY